MGPAAGPSQAEARNRLSMTTWFDVSTRASAESWPAIRRRRSTPPNAARTGARGETFRAALEQAERQFRAAENVSYDSRALNLYYGLSQAGRAIVAASPAVGSARVATVWTRTRRRAH